MTPVLFSSKSYMVSWYGGGIRVSTLFFDGGFVLRVAILSMENEYLEWIETNRNVNNFSWLVLFRLPLLSFLFPFCLPYESESESESESEVPRKVVFSNTQTVKPMTCQTQHDPVKCLSCLSNPWKGPFPPIRCRRLPNHSRDTVDSGVRIASFIFYLTNEDVPWIFCPGGGNWQLAIGNLVQSDSFSMQFQTLLNNKPRINNQYPILCCPLETSKALWITSLVFLWGEFPSLLSLSHPSASLAARGGILIALSRYGLVREIDWQLIDLWIR